MCVGGPVGAGIGTAGDQAGSNVGNFSGIGSPPGTVGVVPSLGQSIPPPVIGDVMGLGYGNQSAMPADEASAIAAESLTGLPFGAGNMSFGNENGIQGIGGNVPSGISDIGIARGVRTGMSLASLAAQLFGNPTLAAIASGASLPLGLFGGAVAMANAARGAGQPPGQIGPAVAAGAGPGGLGGPGEAMTFPSLAGSMPGVTNPILSQQEQMSVSEPRSVSMPVGDITSSLFSVPPPKVNMGNLMASRGVRGAGTKAASPEWFEKGKRGY